MSYPTFDKALFLLPDEPLEILAGAVTTPLDFRSDTYKVKFAIIRKTTFQEKVVFDGVNLGIGVKFENCKFLRGIEFQNCTASGYLKEFNEDSYSVSFNSCRTESIYIQKSLFERGISFNNGNLGTTNFTDLIINRGSIKFDTVTINKPFDLSGCLLEDKAGQITLAKSTLNETVRYENINANGGLAFIQSSFQKDVYIFGGDISSLVFNDGVFNDDFNLEGVRINDSLAIIGATFEKSMKATFDAYQREGYCKQVYITNTKCKRPMEIIGSGKPITEFTIIANTNLEGTYRISNCLILQANIGGDNQSANIRFTDCDFQKLFFSNFTNSSSLAFTSCKAFDKESVFEAENSNFGKLELFNFLFNSFKKVTIADCLTSELVTTGVEWFDDKNLEVADNGRPYRNRREVYRQLKQICDRQGDRIQALEFQALELVAFRNEMRLKEQWLKELAILKSEERGKRIWHNENRWTLRLSSTNNFGLSWTKPLLWIFALTVFLFFPLIVASASPELNLWPATSFNDISTTCRVFWHRIDVLPQLFNPARLTFRLFPDIEQRDLGFGTHFWDGVQRIVLAFFIVQIVSAFRKYVKQ